MVRANRGPATIMAGIAIMMPYSNVFPILALNMAAIAVGAGWGGKYPWVTEREVSMGSPT